MSRLLLVEDREVTVHYKDTTDSPTPRMDNHERMRIRAAAFRSTRLYPGPVGEMLSRELLTWEEFGYRLGGSGLVLRLVDHILNAPLPQLGGAVGYGDMVG